MNKTAKWIIASTGKKKYYVAALVLIQSIIGSIGVIYALFLRNLVDSAVKKDVNSFWLNAVFIIILILVQISIYAVLRWLKELSKSDIENIFKHNLINNILKKNYCDVSSVHTAEWLNRLTNDAKLTSEYFVEIFPDFAETFVHLIFFKKTF